LFTTVGVFDGCNKRRPRKSTLALPENRTNVCYATNDNDPVFDDFVRDVTRTGQTVISSHWKERVENYVRNTCGNFLKAHFKFKNKSKKNVQQLKRHESTGEIIKPTKTKHWLVDTYCVFIETFYLYGYKDFSLKCHNKINYTFILCLTIIGWFLYWFITHRFIIFLFCSQSSNFKCNGLILFVRIIP